MGTLVGMQTIMQVCEKIRDTFGEGREDGRKFYNTVACGNGPFNDAGDEDYNACPGRIEFGTDGCHMLGLMWDLEGAYNMTWPASAPVSTPTSTKPLTPVP